jgi:hypothetical protein
VSANNVTEAIVFVAGTTYAMTFAATNVPVEWGWCVTVGWTTCTSGNTIVVGNLTEATYPYAVMPGSSMAGVTESISIDGHAAPDSGWAPLNHGVAVAVTFTLVTYALTFTETGLATGTTWQVDVQGVFNGQNATTEVGSASTDAITFQVPNGTFNYTVMSVPGYVGPGSGVVPVNGSAVSVSVMFAPPTAATYTVTFVETGLPGGTSWSVTLNGVAQSGIGASLAFVLMNGSYTYIVGSVTGYTSSPSSGPIMVTGANVNQTIVFTPIPPPPITLTFMETGLATGTTWSVTVNGVAQFGSVPSIVFTGLGNGTYGFSVGPVRGYTSSPSSGTTTVIGTDVSQAIVFAPIPSNHYMVTFTESGLPSGVLWYANVTGRPSTSSVGATITMSLLNGTYSYALGSSNPSWGVVPATGSLRVVGAPETVDVTFLAVYTVTMAAGNLPTGTLWYVNVTGTVQKFSYSGTGSTIAFSLPNGTWTYTVASADPRWAPPTPTGTLTVQGVPAPVQLTFASAYLVTFTETGLGSGTSWSVTFYGMTNSSTSTTIAFHVVNGTYAFTTGAVSGYSSASGSGTLTVLGGPVGQTITFTSTSGGGGGSSSIAWWVWVVIAIVIVVIVVVALVVVKRRRPPAT